MSPARPIRLAVRGLLAGLAAGVLLGVSGRAAMALLAVAGGNRPRFSWGGSFEVVLLGVAIGAPAALVFAFVHRLLPGGAVVKGLIFGLMLFGVVAAIGLPAARSAFGGTPPELRRLVPPLFAAPFALYGLVLGSLVQPRTATVLERELDRRLTP